MSYRKRARVSSLAAPVAVSSSVQSRSPYASIRLSGREFVGDVLGAALGTISVNSRVLTPSDANVFKWLSPISRQFSEYIFHRATMIYEPVAASNVQGAVAIMFDQDPSNTAPRTWSDIVATGNSVHGAPWARHVCDAPPALLHARRSYYVRDSYQADATVVDPLEHYPGRFNICVESTNIGGTVFLGTVGKVYIEYDIVLMKPEPAWNAAPAAIDAVKKLSLQTVVSNPAGGVYYWGIAAPSAINLFVSPFSIGGQNHFELASGAFPLSNNNAADTSRTMKFATDFHGTLVFTGTTATQLVFSPALAIGTGSVAGTLTQRFEAPSGGVAVTRMALFVIDAKAGNILTLAATITGAVTLPAGIKMYVEPLVFEADT